MQALEVGQQVQPVELLLLRVPVGPNALEHGRAVVEGVGRDRDPGLVEGHELAPEESPQARG